MLAVLLALAAAVSFGGSDYTAGLAARKASVLRVTVAAGVYLGFRYAAFSVASPVSAVTAAGLSVLAGLLAGQRPDALSLAGIALTVPAIVAVSAGARRQVASLAGGGGADGGPATTTVPSADRHPGVRPVGRRVPGVVCGLGAGAGFGVFLIGLNRAGSGTDLWPVGVADLAGVVTAVCVAVLAGQLGMPPPGTRRLCLLTGAVAATGTMSYFLATHRGLLAVTAVIYSLYPAGTIVLARVFSGERLTVVRITGLFLAAGSVGLIAAGAAR